ncbi:MAG: DUF4013 domain-containing protein [Caldilineaceae bacterium]
MDIVKSFTFITEDEQWIQKLGIGVAVILISLLLSPILIGIAGFLILVGYSVRLLQNVRDGHARPLPAWDHWGEDMVDGFKLAVAGLLYALPILILMIPTVIGSALSENSEAGQIIGVPLLFCGICLTVLYGLFLSVAQPGIMIAFARDKSIRSALDFGTVWEWTRRNIGPVIIVTLVYLAASAVIPFAATLIGTLLCVVGLVVTIPLGTLVLALVQAHLYGQLAAADPMGGAPRAATVPPVAPASASSGASIPSPVTSVPPVTPVDPFADWPASEVPATAPEMPSEVASIEPSAVATPVTDMPVADWPVTESPVTESPVTESPVIPSPVTESPVTDLPATDIVTLDAPAADLPPADLPPAEEPRRDEPTNPGGWSI